MWSDNETSTDFLDCGHVVGAVRSIVCNDRLLPTTIGVFGDWGSGKSSVLRMVQSELETDESILCLSFNGWLFEGYEDAKTALMGTILDQITERRSLGPQATELAKSLFQRVDLMKVAGLAWKHGSALAVGGPAALGLTLGGDALSIIRELVAKGGDALPDQLKDLVKDAPATGQQVRQSVAGFRSEFSKLLDETNIQKLVVVIDDLDRCNPDTIIETLEAIKLFLFVPKTAFILGADERLVKYAVRRRFPELPGENVEVGRDYLEKLVQFPVRVPPLGRSEMETYIGLLFASTSNLSPDQFEGIRQRAVHRSPEHLYEVTCSSMLMLVGELLGTVPDDLAESLTLAQRIAPVLTAGLSGNPRQCKRFLNALLMRLGMAEARGIALQRRILAKLMLLEYLRPETFKRVAALQAEQAGEPVQLVTMEGIASPVPKERRDRRGEQGRAESEKASASTPGRPAAPDQKRESPKAPGPKVEHPAPGVAPTDEMAPEFTAWLTDPWICDWLKSEPPLRGVDLRPYFYFSRDILGPLGGAIQRMSPAAQDVLRNLVNESEGVRQVALRQAPDLSAADAAAVFEALVGRVEQEEDAAVRDPFLKTLVGWTKARSELLGQLITFLDRLPESSLSVAIIPQLTGAAQGKEVQSAAEQLLRRWSTSSVNKRLAEVAGRWLQRNQPGAPPQKRSP